LNRIVKEQGRMRRSALRTTGSVYAGTPYGTGNIEVVRWKPPSRAA
jgi:hypothetical protein